MSDLGLRIVEAAGPCSACGDGNTAMEYHNHEPPPPSYTLKEIEALAREWVKVPNAPVDYSPALTLSTFIAYLARREREGRSSAS